MNRSIFVLILCIYLSCSQSVFAYGRRGYGSRNLIAPYPLYNQFHAGCNAFNRQSFNVNRSAVQVKYVPWSYSTNQWAQGMLNSAQSGRYSNEIIFVAGRPIGSGWLGISLFPENKGLVITELVQNSPAAIGGLMPGDIIIGCNGKRINDINTFDGIMNNTFPGERISLMIIRTNKRKTVYLRVGKQ